MLRTASVVHSRTPDSQTTKYYLAKVILDRVWCFESELF